jgi:hypothetical protein
MRGFIFQITTFIESITTRDEKVELPLQAEQASPTSHGRPTSLRLNKSNRGSAYRFVTEKFCLQLFINLQDVPGVMQTSLSS